MQGAQEPLQAPDIPPALKMTYPQAPLFPVPVDNHSPDRLEVWIYETPERNWTDDGYGTDDDLSEMEGDKVEESLMRQKEMEEELV